tara:strand:+ start:714 stop:1601 length:888 start_codon:yes stop_codon:yes gene_type:complete
MSGILQGLVGSLAGATPIPNGGHLFEGLTNGSKVNTTWTAPENVTAISVVCIGTGFKAGGALAYKNAIEVIPGNSYALQVGALQSSNANGDAYFINTTTVRAGGGYHGYHNIFVGDGGGEGGEGYHPSEPQGSGGAGGYAGNGGNGGIRQAYYAPTGANQYLRYTTAPTAGAGGGGGGGGDRSMVSAYVEEDGVWSWQWSWETAENRDASGCVGVYGQGSSGAAGVNATTGTNHTQGSPGSGGQSGAGAGKKYGGGSQEADDNGIGAVRIIWGEGRAFPSTNVTKDYGGVSEGLN